MLQKTQIRLITFAEINNQIIHFAIFTKIRLIHLLK
jgi:hypothetical protein